MFLFGIFSDHICYIFFNSSQLHVWFSACMPAMLELHFYVSVFPSCSSAVVAISLPGSLTSKNWVQGGQVINSHPFFLLPD